MSNYYVRKWTPLDDDGPTDRGPEVVVWDHVFADMQRHAGTDTAK